MTHRRKTSKKHFYSYSSANKRKRSAEPHEQSGGARSKTVVVLVLVESQSSSDLRVEGPLARPVSEHFHYEIAHIAVLYINMRIDDRVD